MIRNGLDASSPEAFVALTPGSVSGVMFQDRVGTTTSTIASATAGVWPPYWVRLVRAGDGFTAYVSPDGAAWAQLGAAQTIPMDATAYVGLAVTASNGTFRCLASSAANRSACRLPRDPCTPMMTRRTVGTVLASRTTPGAMT